MKILLILANQPYNGSDNAYNALRLADNLHKKGEEVRIFLMNDAVDLVRDSTEKPGDYDIDLVAKLKELYRGGVALKVCGSCQKVDMANFGRVIVPRSILSVKRNKC